VKMKICLLHVFSDLAGVSSSGRLRWQTPLSEYCLEIAGSGGIRSCAPMFFSGRLVSEGAWRSSVVCCLHVTRLTVYGDVSDREWHGSRVFEDTHRRLIFVAMRNLLHDS
jgi:hypothetical protein